jgi:hypothetical protein
MEYKILIFDLTGGFTDMKKNLLSIIHFINEYKYKYKFTIKFCTARPQSFKDNIDKEVIKNNYMYDVKNLFDEKTFFIYDNYISFEKIKDEINEENTFNFYISNEPLKIFKDIDFKKELTQKYKEILNNIDKKFIYIGGHFHFYAGYSIYNLLISEEFNKTIIPSKKILDSYNNFKKNIVFPYNFIHYRHENDMKKYVEQFGLQNLCISIDDIIKKNLFVNNDLKIYLATSNIENFYDKKIINMPIEKYNNLFYNKEKLCYFDENAFVDFLIGIDSIDFIGFSYSGFSVVLSELKNSKKYYDK